jgi:hypothetical protein
MRKESSVERWISEGLDRREMLGWTLVCFAWILPWNGKEKKGCEGFIQFESSQEG